VVRGLTNPAVSGPAPASDHDDVSSSAERHSEFAEAFKRAKAAAARWWEERAHAATRRGASGGQVAMMIFMLKNHAPDEYRDRFEVTGKDGGALSLQLLLKSLDEPKTIEHQPPETLSLDREAEASSLTIKYNQTDSGG
jgi:hypothetical protein